MEHYSYVTGFIFHAKDSNARSAPASRYYRANQAFLAIYILYLLISNCLCEEFIRKPRYTGPGCDPDGHGHFRFSRNLSAKRQLAKDSSNGVLDASNDFEFVAGLADPAITLVRLTTPTLNVTSAAWNSSAIGLPIVLRRNLTVEGNQENYTTLDLNNVMSVLRVEDGVVFTMRYLFLENAFSNTPFRDATFSMFFPTPAGNASLATVAVGPAAFVMDICFPATHRDQDIASIKRPSAAAGAQTAISPGQDGCINASTAAEDPGPMKKCWPEKVILVDIAAMGFSSNIAYTNPMFWLRNVTVFCRTLIDQSCLKNTTSASYCYFQARAQLTSNKAEAEQQQQALSSSSSSSSSSSLLPLSDQQHQSDGEAGSNNSADRSINGSSRGGGDLLSQNGIRRVIICSTVIGVPLLAITTAAVLVARRRRQNQPRSSSSSPAAADCSGSSTQAYGGGSGDGVHLEVMNAALVAVAIPDPAKKERIYQFPGTEKDGADDAHYEVQGISRRWWKTASEKQAAAGVGSLKRNEVVDAEAASAHQDRRWHRDWRQQQHHHYPQHKDREDTEVSIICAPAAAGAVADDLLLLKSEGSKLYATATAATTSDNLDTAIRHMASSLEGDAPVTLLTPPDAALDLNIRLKGRVDGTDGGNISNDLKGTSWAHEALLQQQQHYAPKVATAVTTAGAATLQRQRCEGNGAAVVATTAAVAAVAETEVDSKGDYDDRRHDSAVGDDGDDGSPSVVQLLPAVRGKGSFGRVVEGLYRQQRVAVKLLLNQPWGGEPMDDLAETFVQEIEVLSRCRHPNIVKLLAACVEPPQLCLVMELMEASLDKVLYVNPTESSSRLPLTKVLHIGISISRALAYLHPTIVHRDLKPANVLINNPASDTPVVKLTDFGLSRLRVTVATTNHPSAGTPSYMAPECFDLYSKRVSHKADIFSLGVLMWEMLSGTRPWSRLNQIAIAMAVAFRGARLPMDMLDERRCPRKLARLLTACWEADPDRRPAAAEAMKQMTLVLQEEQQRLKQLQLAQQQQQEGRQQQGQQQQQQQQQEEGRQQQEQQQGRQQQEGRQQQGQQQQQQQQLQQQLKSKSLWQRGSWWPSFAVAASTSCNWKNPLAPAHPHHQVEALQGPQLQLQVLTQGEQWQQQEQQQHRQEPPLPPQQQGSPAPEVQQEQRPRAADAVTAWRPQPPPEPLLAKPTPSLVHMSCCYPELVFVQGPTAAAAAAGL